MLAFLCLEATLPDVLCLGVGNLWPVRDLVEAVGRLEMAGPATIQRHRAPFRRVAGQKLAEGGGRPWNLDTGGGDREESKTRLWRLKLKSACTESRYKTILPTHALLSKSNNKSQRDQRTLLEQAYTSAFLLTANCVVVQDIKPLPRPTAEPSPLVLVHHPTANPTSLSITHEVIRSPSWLTTTALPRHQVRKHRSDRASKVANLPHRKRHKRHPQERVWNCPCGRRPRGSQGRRLRRKLDRPQGRAQVI